MIVGKVVVGVAEREVDACVLFVQESVQFVLLLTVALADKTFGAVAVHGVAEPAFGYDNEQSGRSFGVFR